jgi:hypothetical protein
MKKLFTLKENANRYNSPLGTSHCQWDGYATFTFGWIEMHGTLRNKETFVHGLYIKGTNGDQSVRTNYGTAEPPKTWMRSGCTNEEAEAFVRKCFEGFETLEPMYV